MGVAMLWSRSEVFWFWRLVFQNVVLLIKKRKKKNQNQTLQLPRGHTGDDQPENQSYFKQQGKNDGAGAPSHASPFPAL